MLGTVLLASLIFPFLNTALALPADYESSRDIRNNKRSANLRLHLPSNSTDAPSNVTAHFLTTQTHKPYCFIDPWIPLINAEDCLYTDWEISSDKHPPSVTQPITFTKMRRWIVRSCGIAVVPVAPTPKDTLSKLDILGQAHRVKEKCERAPHGFRGGFVGIGNGDFQVLMKRRIGDIGNNWVVEL